MNTKKKYLIGIVGLFIAVILCMPVMGVSAMSGMPVPEDSTKPFHVPPIIYADWNDIKENPPKPSFIKFCPPKPSFIKFCPPKPSFIKFNQPNDLITYAYFPIWLINNVK